MENVWIQVEYFRMLMLHVVVKCIYLCRISLEWFVVVTKRKQLPGSIQSSVRCINEFHLMKKYLPRFKSSIPFQLQN